MNRLRPGQDTIFRRLSISTLFFTCPALLGSGRTAVPIFNCRWDTLRGITASVHLASLIPSLKNSRLLRRWIGAGGQGISDPQLSRTRKTAPVQRRPLSVSALCTGVSRTLDEQGPSDRDRNRATPLRADGSRGTPRPAASVLPRTPGTLYLPDAPLPQRPRRESARCSHSGS